MFVGASPAKQTALSGRVNTAVPPLELLEDVVLELVLEVVLEEELLVEDELEELLLLLDDPPPHADTSITMSTAEAIMPGLIQIFVIIVFSPDQNLA